MQGSSDHKTRPPAVAGLFYEMDPRILIENIEQLMGNSSNQSVAIDKPLKALIIPHAGHIFSGRCAAPAYQLLAQHMHRFNALAILSPAHRVYIDGWAVPSWQAFATPLGKVEVEQSLCNQVREFPDYIRSDRVHKSEHGIEVHLPFLQFIHCDLPIIPIAVGNCKDDSMQQLIHWLLQHQVLPIISTDLSHFLTYQEAQELDARTDRAIRSIDADAIDNQQACGAIPLRALLRNLSKSGSNVVPLERYNSGDINGDQQRVVGYASYAIF